MSKTRTTAKAARAPHTGEAPPDLVSAMLAADGGPAAAAFAETERAPRKRTPSRRRAAQRAELVSDILAELEAEEAVATATRPWVGRRTAAWSRVSFNLSDELMRDVRDATYHLSGPPEGLNLSRFAERALRRELARLRAKHTAGKPFPRRP